MKGFSCKSYRQCGFTLVELIMVIALAGIVAVMISTVMSRPLQGFVDQSRRAELTDLAASALNRMARDIRLAVPNSLRNEPNCSPLGCHTLELLAISEGGRYRANEWGTSGMRYDPPRCPESGGCSIPVLSPGMDAGKVAEARWMVIYNTGQAVWNYPSGAGPAVITPNNVQFELGCTSSEPCLNLTGAGATGFSFQYASPQHQLRLSIAFTWCAMYWVTAARPLEWLPVATVPEVSAEGYLIRCQVHIPIPVLR